jgi:hypothetical protein
MEEPSGSRAEVALGGGRLAPPPGRSGWGGPPQGSLWPGGPSLLVDASVLGANCQVTLSSGAFWSLLNLILLALFPNGS